MVFARSESELDIFPNTRGITGRRAFEVIHGDDLIDDIIYTVRVSDLAQAPAYISVICLI